MRVETRQISVRLFSIQSEWRPEVDRKNFCKTMLLAASLAGLITASSLKCQEEPASVPETKAPAAQTAPTPAAPAPAAAPAQTPAARLEIHAVDGGPFPTEDAARQSVNGALPPNDEILPYTGGPSSSSGASYYVIERFPIVAGSDFRSVRPGVNSNTGQITVDFTLTPEAGDKFWAYTSANIGKSMAVVMNGKVREAAVIRGPIRDRAVIEGAFNQND